MPAPSTVITFTDEDGDEFPVRLPGVYENRAADVAAGLQIAYEDYKPRGVLTLKSVEYMNEVQS
jgi:hypothetical protein